MTFIVASCRLGLMMSKCEQHNKKDRAVSGEFVDPLVFVLFAVNHLRLTFAVNHLRGQHVQKATLNSWRFAVKGLEKVKLRSLLMVVVPFGCIQTFHPKSGKFLF